MPRKRGLVQQQRNAKAEGQKPDVFRYHDYRVYLKDWLALVRAGQSDLTLRDLAKKLSLSPSLLSMIVSGSRNLAPKAVPLLSSVIGLTEDEQEYFRCLLTFNDVDTPEEKQDAYRRMHRMLSYRKSNPDENRTYEYFSHWYYVAIREMADLEDFRADPEWIQKLLKPKVSLGEIRQALEFLVSHGFIQSSVDGKTLATTGQLDCKGEVYRIALSRFHQEMFSLASNAIETVNTPERNVLGYTAAIDEEKFKRIKVLLDEVQTKISEIAKEPGKSDRVVHVELALFPLTGRK